MDFIVAILTSMFLRCPAVAFPAVGESMSERAGVFNAGLEGYMLMGALAGYYGAYFSGTPWVGVLTGILAGALLSLVHAYLTITQKTSQILSGIAIWIFALGFTAFVYRAVDVADGVKTFGPLHIPGLSRIPYVGEILFQQNALVYLTGILVAVFTFVLFKTRFGLLLRSTGDNPLAVDVAGHNVFRIRYANVLIAGAMAGLGGAYMSVAIVDRFVENMTAGRGFVALALVIFGNWNPLWAFGGALLFTFFDSLQVALQAQGVVALPYPFLFMLPYIVAIIVLVFSGRKAVGPSKLFVPYFKGQE